MPIRTVLERGPKAKRAVAFAVDWPGWSRGAKTTEEALETLESYRERYRPVAVGADLGHEFDGAGSLDIVEDRVGTGSTDFWAISFVPGVAGATATGSSPTPRLPARRGQPADGRSSSCSGTPPSTPWTTPGRWRTRTSQATGPTADRQAVSSC
jgi:hypothetical protein